MEGEIDVESEVGRGSTFRFTLPLGGPRIDVPPPTPERTGLQGLHVLIVDDNDTNRELLHHLVTAWGMRDACAASGRRSARDAVGAATGSVRSRDPRQDDARDGRDRGRPHDPIRHGSVEERVVLLTSMGLRAEAAEARQAGIDAYLSKPVRQSELFDCLSLVMGSRNGGARAVRRHRVLRRRRSGNILLAEDNEVNREVALALSSPWAAPPTSRSDGAEVLAALERTELRPDPDGLPDAADGRFRGDRDGSGRRSARRQEDGPFRSWPSPRTP
jgi:CheY-like chemotaxis protein